MNIIVTTGMPGTGKEEFLSVASSLGMRFVRMGDVVRDAHAERGGDLSVGAFANQERERNGPAIWGLACMERALAIANGSNMVILDGCRSLAEIEVMREHGNVTIVNIQSPSDSRYARLRARGREDAPNGIDEFDERDRRELSWGLGKVIAVADHILLNDGTLDEFKDRSLELLKGLSV